MSEAAKCQVVMFVLISPLVAALVLFVDREESAATLPEVPVEDVCEELVLGEVDALVEPLLELSLAIAAEPLVLVEPLPLNEPLEDVLLFALPVLAVPLVPLAL